MNDNKMYAAEQFNMINAFDDLKEKVINALGENHRIKTSLRMIGQEVSKMLCRVNDIHMDNEVYNAGFISGYEAALKYIDGMVNAMIDQHDLDDAKSNNSSSIATDIEIPSNFRKAVRPIEEYHDLNNLASKAFTHEDTLLNDFYSGRAQWYPRVNQRGYSTQLMETIAVASLVYPNVSTEAMAYYFHVSPPTVVKAINLLTRSVTDEKSA